jgi:hypothetical protein
MKSLASRLLASTVLAAVCWLMLAGAAATTSKSSVLEPDKLIILSTTDVKGKTSPCG